MKKYYWFVYSYNNAGNSKTEVEHVSTDHPFVKMTKIRGDQGRLVRYNITLLNWKEISKEEFELFT